VGGQGWLSDLLAAVMIATTIYCVSRVVTTRVQRRPGEHDVDVVHALMGVAMAGMLVASLKTLPADAWAAVFAASAGWYAWQIAHSYRASGAGSGQRAAIAAHRHHHLPHLAMCCAMVYMLLAAPAMLSSIAGGSDAVGMGGSPDGARFPFLALVLTLILVGFVVWDTDRVSRLPRLASARSRAVSARIERGLAAARAGALAAMSAGPDGQPPLAASYAGPAAAEASSASDGLGSGRANLPVAPRLALCCQIAMGAAMAYMLVLML